MPASATLDLGPLEYMGTFGPCDLESALPAVLALLLVESKNAFRSGGYRGGTPWAPRMNPNIPAILTALGEGSSGWRSRWGQPMPVLRGTGRLGQSITGRVDIAGKAVEWGTNVEYAGTHQEGGSVTLPGAGRNSKNPKVRPNLVKLLKSKPELKGDLSFLFGMDAVTFKIRKRPVVEMTPAIMADVKRKMLEYRLGAKD